MSNIPVNFYKNAFVVDLFLSPQVIPGREEIPTGDPTINDLNVYKMIQLIYDDVRDNLRVKFSNKIKYLGLDVLFALYMVPLIAMALIFRFSIKSTAIVWLPLLWIINQSRPGIEVIDKIKITVDRPWERVILIYSILFILVFLSKLAMVFGIWHFMKLDWLGPLGIMTTRLVDPLELLLWQVTSAVNSALSWAFFFRAKQHLLAVNTAETWPESWVAREYVTFQAVRTAFSLYAVACTFYIAATTAWQIEWPPIRIILFPWAGGGRDHRVNQPAAPVRNGA